MKRILLFFDNGLFSLYRGTRMVPDYLLEGCNRGLLIMGGNDAEKSISMELEHSVAFLLFLF